MAWISKRKEDRLSDEEEREDESEEPEVIIQKYDEPESEPDIEVEIEEEEEQPEIEESVDEETGVEDIPIEVKPVMQDSGDEPVKEMPKPAENEAEEIDYVFPSVELLDAARQADVVADDELKANAELVRAKLANFGVDIESVSVTPGPVITLYELVPASGVKISRIVSLADDLALALAAKGIRIMAPIPGKSVHVVPRSVCPGPRLESAPRRSRPQRGRCDPAPARP